MDTFWTGRRAVAAVLSMLALAGVVCGCAATAPVSARPTVTRAISST